MLDNTIKYIKLKMIYAEIFLYLHVPYNSLEIHLKLKYKRKNWIKDKIEVTEIKIIGKFIIHLIEK